MRATFRPLPVWPYKPTERRRSKDTFKAPWSGTLELLEHEIEFLNGSEIIIAGGFREQDIRLDGMMRSNALTPSHPGIEISFDSEHGRLVYGTDVCEFWQHNVRSIGLGLEALRAVNRYGISRKGEQYAGWLQLGTTSDPVARGQAILQVYGGNVKAALQATHPDNGGDPADFAALQAYRRSGDLPL